MTKHFQDEVALYQKRAKNRVTELPAHGWLLKMMDWLGEHYPLPKNVTVIFVPEAREAGLDGDSFPYTERKHKGLYEIHLRTHGNPGSQHDQEEAVLHEWSHVRNWVCDPDEFCHSDEWALDFVDMYRNWFEPIAPF